MRVLSTYSGTGKPIEQLLLLGPGGVEWFTIIGKVDISGIIVTEKTIIVDGQNIVLTSSNLKMQKAYFYVFSWGGVRRFPTHQRMVRDLVVESEQQQCLLYTIS
jgi:hypothetical protein